MVEDRDDRNRRKSSGEQRTRRNHGTEDKKEKEVPEEGDGYDWLTQLPLGRDPGQGKWGRQERATGVGEGSEVHGP